MNMNLNSRIIERMKPYHFINKNNEIQQYIIYGIGKRGRAVIDELISMGKEVSMIIDGDSQKWGETYKDIPIKNLQSLKEVYSNKDISLIVCSSFHSEIDLQLKEIGINHYYYAYSPVLTNISNKETELFEFNEYYNSNNEKFEEVYDLLFDKESKRVYENVILYRLTGDVKFLELSDYEQYNHPLAKLNNGETMIDGGAYNGDTIKSFNELLNEDYEIHSFEPSEINFKELKKYVLNNDLKNVYVNKLGLDKETKKFYMKTDETSESPANIVSDDGNEEINLISVDDYIKSENLDGIELIKLDIENYELNALIGAQETIKKFNPKLHVCLYHTPEQLTDIILYLKDNYQNYKFVIGHHTKNISETVLYAFI